MAIDLMPNKAAQLARVHTLVYLNDGATDDLAYTALKLRLDHELSRLVWRDVRAAGIADAAHEPSPLRNAQSLDSRRLERAV
jgi:hypothetical protein